MVPLARRHQAKTRIVYSVADLHFVRLARQAEVQGRPELTAASQQMRLTELTAAWHADAVITHSSVEAEVLRRHMRADKIHVVPWDVPLRPTSVPFALRGGIAFIGIYGHPPNVDAAHWLLREIMPRVWDVDPTIACLLVGGEMPDSLRLLRSDRVEPIGHVGDLAEIFDRVRLTVAPLSFGAGLKGKVLDSLAAGIPCVCTPRAAEGLALPAVLARHIASSPAGLAKAIVALHTDDDLNRTCSEAGLSFIRDFASTAQVGYGLRMAARLPGVPNSDPRQ